jgi:hypothetical protein
MSIVLVIIGMIVGGILVGQSLINAAAMRAQISQIEKYNTAVNTFYTKYNCLPGDCANAGSLGFAARGSNPGQGDGNGIIQGSQGTGNGYFEGGGETVMLWMDLSQAGLIAGNFNSASSTVSATITTANAGSYFPAAQIGGGNYIYAWSGGYNQGQSTLAPDGINYFGLSSAVTVGSYVYSSPGLTVAQAYAIDTKVDDGFPQSGKVMAMYLQFQSGQFVTWGAGGGNMGASGANHGPTTSATAGSSTTCYDNGGVSGPTTYSMEQNSGTGINCALSFIMQGAAR